MLVLSRKQNETIVLPDLNLTIRVTAISGGRVRLAVDAPREVRILRQEVQQRADELQCAASSAESAMLV